ncbi:MAG: SCO family protein [Planctomycetota bacterium]
MKRFVFLLVMVAMHPVTLWGLTQVGPQGPVPMDSPTPAEPAPDLLKDLKITEHLGEQLPTDLTFIDHMGQSVRLGDYLNKGKPLVINLVYYECPMLCNQLLNAVVDSIRGITVQPGKDYTLLTFSINPEDSCKLAYEKRATYLASLGKPLDHGDWVFHIGKDTDVRVLAEALGYSYKKNPATGEYVHAPVTMFVTPEGVISRYLYGMLISPLDMRLAIVEAGQGKTGSFVDKAFTWCYSYDSKQGRYTLVVRRVMSVAGALTVMVMGTGLFILWRREFRNGGVK